MRFINTRSSLLLTLLIVGVAVVAIPIAASDRSTTTTVVKERHANLYQQVGAVVENDWSISKVTHGHAAGMPQAYYNRRRQYLEDRVERRMDRRQEYLDQQTGDDDDSSAGDDGDDEEDDASSDRNSDDEDRIESRREYFRQRADRGWD